MCISKIKHPLSRAELSPRILRRKNVLYLQNDEFFVNTSNFNKFLNNLEGITQFARNNQVSITESGLSDTASIPSSISHFARSGWSEGP